MEADAAFMIRSVTYKVEFSGVIAKSSVGSSTASNAKRAQSALSNFHLGIRVESERGATVLSKKTGKWSLPKGLSKTFQENQGSKVGDERDKSMEVKVL